MDSAHDTAQRLTDLEVKACFTEDLLDQLNHVIYQQQQRIDALAAEVAQLRQQAFDHLKNSSGGTSLRDELPPHY